MCTLMLWYGRMIKNLMCPFLGRKWPGPQFDNKFSPKFKKTTTREVRKFLHAKYTKISSSAKFAKISYREIIKSSVTKLILAKLHAYVSTFKVLVVFRCNYTEKMAYFHTYFGWSLLNILTTTWNILKLGQKWDKMDINQMVWLLSQNPSKLTLIYGWFNVVIFSSRGPHKLLLVCLWCWHCPISF